MPTWTTTTPTKPGHYWWRDQSAYPSVVRVHENNEGLMVIRGGYYGVTYLSQMAKWFPKSEWLGPIQPPE